MSTEIATGWRRLDLIAAAVFGVELAAAAWIGGAGPRGLIPMHLGLDGHVDRWGDRNEAALVLAGIALIGAGVYAFLGAMARSSRIQESAQRGIAASQALLLVVLGLLGGLMVAMASGLLGLSSDEGVMLRPVVVFLALTGMVTGFFAGKIAPNPFVGVRTFWSLRSRLAWDKSNRLLGRIYFWGGLPCIGAAFLLPGRWAMTVTIGVLILGALVSVVESWRVWRGDPDRQSP